MISFFLILPAFSIIYLHILLIFYGESKNVMLDFYVYILKCHDGSYYVGHTDNIEARISAHKQGLIRTCYTYKKRPVEVVYSDTVGSRGEAIEAEQQIKGWSRKKKEAFIAGDFDLLKKLSNEKNNEKIEAKKRKNEGK